MRSRQSWSQLASRAAAAACQGWRVARVPPAAGPPAPRRPRAVPLAAMVPAIIRRRRIPVLSGVWRRARLA